MIKLSKVSIEKEDTGGFRNERRKYINLNLFKFPSGETHFKVKNMDSIQFIKYFTVDVFFESNDDIINLFLLTDCLRNLKKNCDIYVNFQYLPFARQDRQTSKNEPFSFKTFAKLLNSFKYSAVQIHDPHSDVSPALIDNCIVKERCPLIVQVYDYIISPDAGAMKANEKICQRTKIPHIVATKVRCLDTGNITRTELHTKENLTGKNLLILDDICDGGRTFVELAKVLKQHNPKSLHLQTTVGLYTKGKDELNKYFDLIDCVFEKPNNIEKQ